MNKQDVKFNLPLRTRTHTHAQYLSVFYEYYNFWVGCIKNIFIDDEGTGSKHGRVCAWPFLAFKLACGLAKPKA